MDETDEKPEASTGTEQCAQTLQDLAVLRAQPGFHGFLSIRSADGSTEGARAVISSGQQHARHDDHNRRSGIDEDEASTHRHDKTYGS
tara:strand:- start:418 stop:681 length:264 start_codon:yes stop_codon:yes gene_type:complete